MELYNVCSSLSKVKRKVIVRFSTETRMLTIFVKKVCEDLRDPAVRTSDTDIKLFSAFKPMLGQRAAIDEVRLFSSQLLQ